MDKILLGHKLKDDPFLLPKSIRILPKFGVDPGIFASEEEINSVKSRVLSENREGKINAILTGSDYIDKKLEDDMEYIRLINKGVHPLPKPSNNLFYVDIKWI